MAIVVFQHSDDCRPGRLGVTLRDHGFRLDVRRIDRGDPVPADLDNVDGLVTLGGPQFVTDSHAWIARECDFIKRVHDASLPVVGVCLGAQMIARALGGEVGPMEAPEIGFAEMRLTPSGQTDTILAGVPWALPVFHHHRHEVKAAPPGTAVLASSDKCKVQAYRVGMRTYGFQYHVEADRAIMNELLGPGGNELHRAGLSAPDFEKQAVASMEIFSRSSDRICVNIASCLIPRVASAMAG